MKLSEALASYQAAVERYGADAVYQQVQASLADAVQAAVASGELSPDTTYSEAVSVFDQTMTQLDSDTSFLGRLLGVK